MLFTPNMVKVRSNYFYNNLNLGLKNVLLQCRHFFLVITYKDIFFEFKTFFKHNNFACKSCFDNCFLPFYLPFLDFFVQIIFCKLDWAFVTLNYLRPTKTLSPIKAYWHVLNNTWPKQIHSQTCGKFNNSYSQQWNVVLEPWKPSPCLNILQK
jgi:hypothetical protein